LDKTPDIIISNTNTHPTSNFWGGHFQGFEQLRTEDEAQW
jgi:hypothetical protein